MTWRQWYNMPATMAARRQNPWRPAECRWYQEWWLASHKDTDGGKVNPYHQESYPSGTIDGTWLWADRFKEYKS